MPSEITDNINYKFLKCLKKYPILYSKKSRSDLYDQRNAREEAISSIAMEMTDLTKKFFTNQDVRQKIRNLQSQYLREIRRMKASPGYVPKYRLFAHAQFIYDHHYMPEDDETDPLKSCDQANVDSKDESAADDSDDDDDDMSTLPLSCELQQNETESSNGHLAETQISNNCEENEIPMTALSDELLKNQALPQKQIVSQFSTLSYDRNPLNIDEPAPKIKKQEVYPVPDTASLLRDEHIIFAESIANELRLLQNDEDLQRKLKYDILQAIVDVNKTKLQRAKNRPNTN